ncbi:unnamed protein product [Clonostachys rhizophaga]|uniref:Uncharacterized protein n=1 Tax=Clonostachys rhizophaga TaxID=160324 RepID=A0A9N9YEQ6_9HYPO|nr:unnamed protein product [Clonostachys rhizophaga]
MPPSPCFTGLPTEVRLQIYEFYFHLPGGLIYSHDKQKLVAKDPEEKLEVSLMFTCRTTAAETQGLPFEFNTVTFTTGCHTSNYSHAGEYSQTLLLLHNQRFEVLSYMRPAISEEIYDETTSRFPLFKPVLDAIKEHWPQNGEDNEDFIREIARWGDVPFSAREAVALTCQLALQSMERETIAAVAGYRLDNPNLPPHDDPLRILTLDHQPWDIPSKSKLQRLRASLYMPPQGAFSWERGIRNDNGIWRNSSQHTRPYHFSAAAVAIHFLQQLSVKQRAHFRNIVLREDSESVAFPACHARGLIPFCQENPCLRIERRVNLIGNVLEVPESLCLARDRFISDMSKALAVWLVEAMDLEPAGMPPNAFSFVLDDDQAPDRAMVAFDKVYHRCLTWQRHMESEYESGDKDTRRFFQLTKNRLYILDGFPRAMEELYRNNGILRCNFNPGEPSEVTESSIWTMDDYATIDIVDELGFDQRTVMLHFNHAIGEVFGDTELPGLL